MPKTDFPGFLRKVKPEITLVEGLLRQPLSEEPEGLIADLLKIEVWYARIQTILAFAEGYLDLAEREKLPTKETRTELDREKELASRVAAERLLRDRASGLVEALKTRIMLGQTLLNYYRDVHVSDRPRTRKPSGPDGF
ncbi:MAG TPA: hypothetical protein PKN80_05810 [bacterium]|uniref:FlgN protein n=1 Tax=candidate division TA06 bacterium ADurb.Bin417 TaxID=1852828 RepID=A0A1V5MLC8_UNCT6|nr:MAG: hypothetical protein BWY73_00023 [candidate division TA06 bacterium ADurb.Bin417]HNQ35563.1 hypothetical protein [bacterium]HNS48735.1 hypothetical protein [bacterium]